MSERAEYLKVADVAQTLSVTTAAVYLWIEQGRIEAIQLAGKKKGSIRIPRKALESFIKASKIAALKTAGQ